MRKTDDYSRQTFDGISIWDAGVRLDFNKRLNCQHSNMTFQKTEMKMKNRKCDFDYCDYRNLIIAHIIHDFVSRSLYKSVQLRTPIILHGHV